MTGTKRLWVGLGSDMEEGMRLMRWGPNLFDVRQVVQVHRGQLTFIDPEGNKIVATKMAVRRQPDGHRGRLRPASDPRAL
jgi:hypothetical protein